MTEPLPASTEDPLGLLGSTIGEKYVIERFVAEGGFSLLYRAQHTIWKQPVAVKFLKAMASAPPDQRQGLLNSFVQEGQLLRQLSSRTASILQAHDVGTWVGPAGEWYPYLILEWLDGQPLDQLLDDRRAAGEPPLTLPQILAHLESVARALEVVHRRGVAHRDIKPANLFVVGDLHGDDAFVKVLDFGIAKVLGDMAEMSAATARTGSAVSSFTPWYGAPEQFSKRHGATGPWTDVFALALVMVEMLTLQAPLEGDDLVQLALQSTDPAVRPTPRQRGVQVSDEVEAVFARALAVDPAARYPTLGPFWNDLCQAAGAEQYVDQATQSLEVSRQSLLRSAGLDPSLIGGAGTVPASALAELASRELPLRRSGSNPAAGQGSPASVAPVSASTHGPPSERSINGLGPLGDTTTQNASAHARTLPEPVLAPGGSGAAGRRPWWPAAALAGVLALGAGAWALRPTPAADPGPTPLASTSAAAAATSAPALATPSCPAGMVLIPGGEFYMGFDGAGAFEFEQPPHSVKLGAFCIDVTEVTVEDYRACSDAGKCQRADTSVSWPGVTARQKKVYGPLCNIDDAGRDRHPINCVDWDMASNYCARQGKRLPTSAEWEFAVRGPDGRTYPWGDEPPSANRLNACGRECIDWAKKHGVASEMTAMHDEDDGFPTTAPVGSFPKGRSRYGLDDVIGNVMEWVQDWNGPYSKDSEVNPRGPASGTERVIRGGAWSAGQMHWVRPSFRFQFDPAARSHGVGFRCAR